METVKSLRQKGLKVVVYHHRRITQEAVGGGKIDEKGGFTEISVLSKEGKFLSGGKSVCSNKDNYDKKMGVKIALGRAIANLEINL